MDDFEELKRRREELLSRIRIASIRLKTSSGTPDQKSKEEIEDLELARKREEVDALHNQNESAKQDREHRKEYAPKLFYLSCSWIAVTVLMLLAQGSPSCTFCLPDSVVLATIGSTTATIVGLLYIVANYLFPKR